MLISLNKIKEYVKIDIPTDELIKLIGSRLVEVEGTIDLAPKYQGIKIAKVISAEPIPDTHLHLCQIDAGAQADATADAKFNPAQFADPATGLIQVVCGAPNVHAGMLAAWLMPGSIVPSTYGNENFKLSTRKLRGYDSNGMLAAADELDLGSDHAGIIEIDPKMTITEAGASRPVRSGDDFAAAFDLNDIILDIENKSLTHRPDCFGLIGFAREVAGILGQKFALDESEPPIETSDDCNKKTMSGKSEPLAGVSDSLMRFRPDLGMSKLQQRASGCNFDNSQVRESETPLTVRIMNDEICPRYSCAVLDCTKLLEKSKYFTRDDAFLAKSGMRGISPIVDLTNILMLETGQPLHAFDYDKFVSVGGAKSPQIVVRLAKSGEQLQLLDGKTIDCVATDILITSNDVPVALAGAMGGTSTEIDASSTKIILESATFSLYNLRKTQMAHGIFSEAITRFTKGQPASQTLPVLEEAIHRLGVQPLAIADAYPHPAKPIVVKITTPEINSLLGTRYSTKTIINTLENVGFAIKADGSDSLDITTPAWRTDIHIKEDIIEEVGRLLGFDNIPITLPTKSFSGTTQAPLWQLKSTIRSILSDKLAAHELLTYSFVSGDLLNKVGEDPARSYKIVNSISPELQYFRQTLTPSLLDKVYQNVKAGLSDFTIYEINQVVDKSEQLDADGVPPTHTHLSVLTFGDFYKIKQIATFLIDELNTNTPITPADSQTLPSYFEPLHSASTRFGHFGEIRQSVLRHFKLGDYTMAALEFDLGPILAAPTHSVILPAMAFSRFPIVHRDLTFRTPDSISYGELRDALHAALLDEDIIYDLQPTYIYQPEQPEQAAASRNISFHLAFASTKQTLTSEQISAIIERVINKLQTLSVAAV